MSQSHGSNTVNLGMYTLSRKSGVETEHQNGGERWFNSLGMAESLGRWCQMFWSGYFRSCWCAGAFSHLQSLQRMVRKAENIQWAVVPWAIMPCWWLVWDDRNATVTQITNCYNQGMQKNASHIKPWTRCATAADDHSECCFCQLRTGNWGCHPYGLNNTGQ